MVTENFKVKSKFKDDSWINLKDLYYALMLPSGHDAAKVIAENLGSLLALND